MENIFYTNRDLFIDKGYDVVPAFGKNPNTKDWYNKDFSLIDDSYYISANIGLKTGKASGVICVDIDTKDRALQEEIYKILPPLLSGKIGNKEKGTNYFFAYNGEERDSIANVLDLLSTGQHTVLPPSIHVDKKYPYEWVGKTLLEIDKDDLAPLPKDFMSKVRAIVGETVEQYYKEGGRNNKLKAIVGAMLERGEVDATIIDEIYRYDKEKHSPRLFIDEREQYKAKNELEAKQCAWEFVINITRTAVKQRKIAPPTPFKFELVEHRDIEPPDYKKYKYTRHFRGIAQEIFKSVYNNSKVPRTQFSVASTLACMSTLLGNKIQYEDTYTNLYLMILGKSASGKDYPLKFPYKLFAKAGLTQLIGEGSPSSHTALIHNLTDNKVRLDAIDEASFLFRGMNAKESFTAKMAEIYQTLYTSAGDYYAGVTATIHKSEKNKSGRLGECTNPHISLSCAMTISDFSETFNTRLMEKGLGGRFMYFVDQETKYVDFKDKTPIPNEIIDYCQRMRPTEAGLYDFSNEIMSISITPQTKKYFLEVRKQLDRDSKKHGVNEKIAPILGRKAQLLTKIALIDACSVQWERPISEVNMSKDSIDWALDFVDTNSNNMGLFINDYLAGGKQERMVNLIKQVLAENNGRMSKTELANNGAIRRELPLAQERDTYLRSMASDGIISIQMEGIKNNKACIVLI